MIKYYFFATVTITCLALVLFSGVYQGIKKTFRMPPEENHSQNQSIIENQSEKTARIKERNEHLMEQLHDKMERLKRN
ncbi:MAG: hypothetical protein V2A70_05205 [Candidatus Omnitrophota bacterium]